MGTLLQILFFAITNWREIAGIIKAIGEIIKANRDKKVRTRWTSELSEAVKVYAKSKDKRPLEALLCKLKGNC